MNRDPDDRPDTLNIGPVHDIPIIDADDPRFTAEGEAWSRARAIAQAKHSPDDLLAGLSADDWMVRHECIDRLIARGHDDPRTLPALLDLACNDPVEEVRATIVLRLHEFDAPATREVLRVAQADPSPEVRWSAEFALAQLGHESTPD